MGIKWIKIHFIEFKISLFAEDMILYIKHPKNSTKNLLQLINTFSKVAQYRINVEKLLFFLYTNSKQTKNMKGNLFQHPKKIA